MHSFFIEFVCYCPFFLSYSLYVWAILIPDILSVLILSGNNLQILEKKQHIFICYWILLLNFKKLSWKNIPHIVLKLRKLYVFFPATHQPLQLGSKNYIPLLPKFEFVAPLRWGMGIDNLFLRIICIILFPINCSPFFWKLKISLQLCKYCSYQFFHFINFWTFHHWKIVKLLPCNC